MEPIICAWTTSEGCFDGQNTNEVILVRALWKPLSLKNSKSPSGVMLRAQCILSDGLFSSPWSVLTGCVPAPCERFLKCVLLVPTWRLMSEDDGSTPTHHHCNANISLQQYR